MFLHCSTAVQILSILHANFIGCQYRQSTKYEGMTQKGGCKIALFHLGFCVSGKCFVHFWEGTGSVAVFKPSFHLVWSVPFLVDYSVGIVRSSYIELLCCILAFLQNCKFSLVYLLSTDVCIVYTFPSDCNEYSKPFLPFSEVSRCRGGWILESGHCTACLDIPWHDPSGQNLVQVGKHKNMFVKRPEGASKTIQNQPSVEFKHHVFQLGFTYGIICELDFNNTRQGP